MRKPRVMRVELCVNYDVITQFVFDSALLQFINAVQWQLSSVPRGMLS